MLKTTIERDPGIAALKLEGKLAGPWAHELEPSWRAVRTLGTSWWWWPLRSQLRRSQREEAPRFDAREGSPIQDFRMHGDRHCGRNSPRAQPIEI